MSSFQNEQGRFLFKFSPPKLIFTKAAKHDGLIGGSKVRVAKYALSVEKRAFDVIVAVAALLLLSPLLLLIAAAIRLESGGPILFTQRRWGLNQTQFLVYKFRSMYVDRCDVSGVKQTTEADPRITRVGAAIRRLNLDELPQLWNVLKGEMSIVGPRCHPVGMLAGGRLYEDLIKTYHNRHDVRPGITGLAQMRGYRGPTTDKYKASSRIWCDLAYAQKATFIYDTKIIIGTVMSEFKGGNGF